MQTRAAHPAQPHPRWTLMLRSGSLDEPARIKPVSHFAIETRIAEWHADDGLPGTRLDEHQRLMQRWKDAYGDGVVPGVAATRGA